MANPQVKTVRVRMAFDISKWLSQNVVDIISNSAPQFPSGSDISLETMFSYGVLNDSPSTVIDLSVYASVIVALQSTNTPHEGTTYWSQTTSSYTNTITAAQWADGTAAHAQIVFAIPNSVWTVLNTGPSSVYWMVIYGTTTDSPAKLVPFAAFQLTVQDTGMPVGNVLSAPSLIGTQSFLCSDSLYRKLNIQQDSTGTWVPVVVDQTGASSP